MFSMQHKSQLAECYFPLHAMKVNGAVKLIKYTLVQYITSYMTSLHVKLTDILVNIKEML